MNERIKQLRDHLDLTLESFGSKVGVTRAAISNVEKGRSNPSEQLIRSICREFRVSEEWLRSGEGEMFHQVDDEQELQDIFSEITVSDDDLIKRIIKGYWKLGESEKAVIKKLIDSLS